MERNILLIIFFAISSGRPFNLSPTPTDHPPGDFKTTGNSPPGAMAKLLRENRKLQEELNGSDEKNKKLEQQVTDYLVLMQENNDCIRKSDVLAQALRKQLSESKEENKKLAQQVSGYQALALENKSYKEKIDKLTKDCESFKEIIEKSRKKYQEKDEERAAILGESKKLMRYISSLKKELDANKKRELTRADFLKEQEYIDAKLEELDRKGIPLPESQEEMRKLFEGWKEEYKQNKV